jgi:hypothetical protein
MKKILVFIILALFITSSYAGVANIRATGSKYRIGSGYQYLLLEAYAVPAYAGVTPSALTWYADNIAGYSRIGISGIAVSTGSTPTTISAQPLYSDGTNCGSAVTITAGTDLTAIKSPYYKFTLPAYSSTRNVSFGFIIAD